MVDEPKKRNLADSINIVKSSAPTAIKSSAPINVKSSATAVKSSLPPQKSVTVVSNAGSKSILV